MEDRKGARSRNHSVIMENREKLSISGVEHVHSFNSETVVLDTVLGLLTIKGENIDINKLNVEDGNLSIKGSIQGFNYSDRESLGAKGSGFLGKLFK